MKKALLSVVLAAASVLASRAETWIRINQLGYLPRDVKMAVLMSEERMSARNFELIEAGTGKVVGRFGRKDSAELVPGGPRRPAICPTGSWGSMKATYRLNFSAIHAEGTYYIRCGRASSPTFRISRDVYDGTADFLLSYMRQQRCGYNPFLQDSCHRHDAYITGHPDKEGQRLDVRGGWHDASDCLRYTATTANSVFLMMYAFEQCASLTGGVFADQYDANGQAGQNGVPDVVDEIRWGMDWLCRMNPQKDEMYNQLADDRDHAGMRLPPDDDVDYGYGPGLGRPVYLLTGRPQQRHHGLNSTTGAASTAGKFASTFALGAQVLAPYYPTLADSARMRAADAYRFGLCHPGYTQTASVRSPYIYEESNWTDDMELAAAELFRLTGDSAYLRQALDFSRREPVTPWMGQDTARHYEWYPFINMGHVRLGLTQLLREGISRVRQHGMPYIWCSNNLTAAMLTQCIAYREQTGDLGYVEMEAALRDWLLGCNPWGTSMVCGLPQWGVYPRRTHSPLTYTGRGTTTGGLVDGPVYRTIFESLAGVHLEGDSLASNYERFNSGRMVYHDNMHDYSTNEPTLDGTAALLFPLAYYQSRAHRAEPAAMTSNCLMEAGGIVRMDTTRRNVYLCFTAHEFADGADTIIHALRQAGVKASFFFTGRTYELHPDIIRRLLADGHYVGSHSFGHVLYMPWENRDSLLITQEEFNADLRKAYQAMGDAGITPADAPVFMPPYEYYNHTISRWASQLGLQLVCYTPGIGTNADYTTPDMHNYRSSAQIMERLLRYEAQHNLNGAILLLHFGTHPDRTDKFYHHLPQLISELQARGYSFCRF